MSPTPLLVAVALASTPLWAGCGAAELYPPAQADACRAGAGETCLAVAQSLRADHPLKARVFLTEGCDAKHAPSCGPSS